jgi:PAS domain S-box-containing protein
MQISARGRLLMVVSLALLPAFGLLLYSAWEQRREATRDAQDAGMRLAVQAAQQHERVVEGVRALLTVLAELPAVQRHETDQCSALLADTVKRFPQLINVGAVDLKGNIFCNSRPLAAPLSIAEEAHFQGAIATRAFAVGPHRIGPLAERRVVVFGYPAIDARGAVRAVVTADLDLDWLGQVGAAMKLPEGSVLTVFDDKGIILTRSSEPERWVGKPLPGALINGGPRERVADSIGADGVRRLLGTVRLQSTASGSLWVSVGIPTDVALGPARRALIRNLLVMLAAAAAALGAAWVLGNIFIVGPARALRASEERYRGLFERNIAGTFLGRSDGQLLDCNPAFVRLLGYSSREEALGVKAPDFYADVAERERLIARLEAEGLVTNHEMTWKRADGSQFPVMINVRVDRHGLEPRFEGMAVDITDRKHAEDAARLRSVAQLASAAAHEINNPLTVVIGNMGLLKTKLAGLPQLHVYFERCERGMRRIAEMVSHMQHITRLAPLEGLDTAGMPVLDLRRSSESDDSRTPEDGKTT